MNFVTQMFSEEFFTGSVVRDKIITLS